MAHSNKNKIGGWAFVIGVVLAIIIGLFGQPTQGWTIILLVIGLVVGLLNIADEEVQPFLMSGVVLIIAGAFGAGIVNQVPVVANMMTALLAIFVPATIIVALKNVFTLARR